MGVYLRGSLYKFDISDIVNSNPTRAFYTAPAHNNVKQARNYREYSNYSSSLDSYIRGQVTDIEYTGAQQTNLFALNYDTTTGKYPVSIPVEYANGIQGNVCILFTTERLDWRSRTIGTLGGRVQTTPSVATPYVEYKYSDQIAAFIDDVSSESWTAISSLDVASKDRIKSNMITYVGELLAETLATKVYADLQAVSEETGKTIYILTVTNTLTGGTDFEGLNDSNLIPSFYAGQANLDETLIDFITNGTIDDATNKDAIDYRDIDFDTSTDYIVYVNERRDITNPSIYDGKKVFHYHYIISWKNDSIIEALNDAPYADADAKLIIGLTFFNEIYDAWDSVTWEVPYSDRSFKMPGEYISLKGLVQQVTVSLRSPNEEIGGSIYFSTAGRVAPLNTYGVSSGDGSTIKIAYDTEPDDDWGYDDNKSVSTTSEDDTELVEGKSVSGIFTTSLVVAGSTLGSLANFIWQDSLFENIKLWNNSPIENIISIKHFPVTASGGADTQIVLGNVETGLRGNLISKNIITEIGSLSIPSYYKNFLDYAPYTKLVIFLPYCGFYELDVSEFMGKTLSVKYIHDIITGQCKACLFADGIYVQSFNGVSGIDIPLTASNRSQIESGIIRSAVSAGVAVASGNPIAIAGGIFDTVKSATAPYHYTTNGTYAASIGNNEPQLCYLIIDRPIAQYPASYNHEYGKPCLLTKTLGLLKGYTECGPGIHLDGIICTDSERSEIESLLTSGVIL